MQRLLILPVAALLVLPAVGCDKVQARAELKKGNCVLPAGVSTPKRWIISRRGWSWTRTPRSPGARSASPPSPCTGRATMIRGTPSTPTRRSTPSRSTWPTTRTTTRSEDYLLSTYVNASKFDEALGFIDQRLADKPQESAKLNGYKIRILTQAGRLDQAFQLAAQSTGDDRAEALYSIAVSAWDKSFHDPGTMDFDAKNRLVDIGLDAIKKSYEAKKDSLETMVYYNLLLREKAKLELDETKRAAIIAEADGWQKKALELRKKSHCASGAGPCQHLKKHRCNHVRELSASIWTRSNKRGVRWWLMPVALVIHLVARRRAPLCAVLERAEVAEPPINVVFISAAAPAAAAAASSAAGRGPSRRRSRRSPRRSPRSSRTSRCSRSRFRTRCRRRPACPRPSPRAASRAASKAAWSAVSSAAWPAVSSAVSSVASSAARRAVSRAAWSTTRRCGSAAPSPGRRSSRGSSRSTPSWPARPASRAR